MCSSHGLSLDQLDASLGGRDRGKVRGSVLDARLTGSHAYVRVRP